MGRCIALVLMGMTVVCGGCRSYGQALEDTAAALNARQVKACIQAQGLYRPFVSIHAIIFTGGATIETCQGAAPWRSSPLAPRVESLPTGEPACQADCE